MRDRPGSDAPPRWFRAAARVRGLALTGGYLGIIAGVVARVFQITSDALAVNVALLGGLLLALSVGLGSAIGVPRITARPVSPPVRGRWVAFNSPASRVPSHRTHGHGQTFAIDLAYRPDGDFRLEGKDRAFRPPQDFPGFGQEVVAPAAGRVVVVRDRQRDHRSRWTPDAIRMMGLESFVREAFGGARLLAGNLVVLDLGGGIYAALAHLKRGSAVVRRGQEVALGQVLARCGNSGNCTEPHVHFQLMDHPSMLLAAGLPFTFSDDDLPAEGCVPRNDEVIVAWRELESGGRLAM